MEYLEKNRKAFQEHYPSVYPLLQEALAKEDDSFANLHTAETRDGNLALVIDKEGKSVRLNSIYRPFAEAEKWAQQYPFQNLEVTVLLFGLGNGYFARQMLQRMKMDAIAHIYEPDLEVFLYVLHHFDISDILTDARAVVYIEGLNVGQFEDTLDYNLDWIQISSQIYCEHPSYRDLYTEKCTWFQKTIQKVDTRYLVNRDTAVFMAKSIPKNVIKNLHFIKKSNYTSEFVGKIPREVPVIIVSAGPSLDKNIEQLKRAAGKSFILATDTAVKYLVAKGLPFDAMVTIDSRKSMKHLKSEECKNVPLFCVPEAKNAILERHTGRKIWLEGMYYLEELYRKFHREFPPYNPGGSVATAAFMLGLSLGFQRFVLIGQDLAYSDENGTTHAGNITKELRSGTETQEMVEGINGNMVLSRGDWILYRDWFEATIRAKPELEVIDATEGGALIHGTKVMTFSDVIDTYCLTEFDFATLLEQMPYTFEGKEYEEVKRELLHLQKEFRNIAQKAEEGKKAADELKEKIRLGSSTPELENRLLKKIRKATNFIQKQTVYSLFDMYITDKIADSIQKVDKVTGDEKQDMLATLTTSQKVFQALTEGVEELQPLLEETLIKI